METNISYTAVGAFVLGLLSVFIIAVIWLSSGLSREEFSFYKVYMNESVSGLSLDSSVEFNGVSVGAVKKIEISPTNPRIVEVLLKIKNSTPVTQGTSATLEVKGFTGIAFIALKDLGKDPAPLIAKRGETIPVIKTIPSFFLKLDTALTELNTHITQVSKSIQTLLNPQNQESIQQILNNLNHFSRILLSSAPHIESTIRNSERASANVGLLVQGGSESLPLLNQSLANLLKVTQDLTVIGSQIKRNPAVLIRGTEPARLGPGE